MPDRSIELRRDNQGLLELTKTIGNKKLVFRFNSKENRAVHVNTSGLDRLYSSADLWVSKSEFIAACKQATAIFKEEKEKSQNGKLQPSQSQLTFSYQI